MTNFQRKKSIFHLEFSSHRSCRSFVFCHLHSHAQSSVIRRPIEQIFVIGVLSVRRGAALGDSEKKIKPSIMGDGKQGERQPLLKTDNITYSSNTTDITGSKIINTV